MTAGDDGAAGRETLVVPTPELVERLHTSRRRAIAAAAESSAAAFAQSINSAERTVRRYLAGERAIPRLVLLRWEEVCGLRAGELTEPHPRPWNDVAPRSGRRLVGRGAELDSLRVLWQRGATDHAIVVAGESGIGKTALLGAAAQDASDAGCLVLWGRCIEHGAAAYHPIAEALRGFGELPIARRPGETWTEAGDQAVARSLFHRGVLDVVALAAHGRRSMLFIDDVQWADEATLQLLGHLLANAERLGLGVILTRSTTGTPQDDLDRHITQRPGVSELELRGLSAAAIEQLLPMTATEARAERARRARSLHRATHGNPLHLTNLLQGLDGGADLDPDEQTTVQGAVRSVVARRTTEAITVLEVASVIGRSFAVDVLDEVLALVAAPIRSALTFALVEATGAGIVGELHAATDAAGDRSVGFSHDVVRRTIYDQIAAPRRAELHAAVLQVLAGAPEGRRASPATLAYHALRAGGVDAVHTAGLLHAAALEAFERFDLRGSSDHAIAGLRVLDDAGASDLPAARMLQIDLLLLRAKATFERDPAEARVLAREAITRARPIDDGLVLGRAVKVLCGFVIVGHRDDDLAPLCEEALRAVRSDVAARSRLEAAWASALLWSGTATPDELERVDALLAAAHQGATETGDASTLARSLHGRCQYLYGSPDLARRRSVADELEVTTSRLTWQVGLAMLAGGDRHGFDAEQRRFAASEHPWDQAIAHLWVALQACLDGRWDDVVPAASASLAMLPDNTNIQNSFGLRLYHCYRETGRLAEVVEMAERMLAAVPGLTAVHDLRALAYCELGRYDEAEELIVDLAARLDQRRGGFGYPMILASAIEVGAVVGRVEVVDARRRARLAPYSGQMIVMPAGCHVHGPADRFLAIGAGIAGDAGQAARYFARAGLLEQQLRAPSLALHTRYWEIVVAGRSADGLRSLADEARALGMVALAERCDRTAAHGLRPREP